MLSYPLWAGDDPQSCVTLSTLMIESAVTRRVAIIDINDSNDPVQVQERALLTLITKRQQRRAELQH